MWKTQKIEKLYQQWIAEPEPFSVHGTEKFLKFVCACFLDKGRAPSPHDLLNRVKTDHSKLCPSKSEEEIARVASQAESLFVDIFDYEKIKEEFITHGY